MLRKGFGPVIRLAVAMATTLNGTQPGYAEEGDNLREAAQNPIGDLISLPFQNNTNFDIGHSTHAAGRAEVIGEATGGGAHPTRPFPISAAVHIGIPFARSINPVTGTNWQGTGVLPDTPVPADQAYAVGVHQSAQACAGTRRRSAPHRRRGPRHAHHPHRLISPLFAPWAFYVVGPDGIRVVTEREASRRAL